MVTLSNGKTATVILRVPRGKCTACGHTLIPYSSYSLHFDLTVLEDYFLHIIDEETAPVVQKIYQLCLAGNAPAKIARMLPEQHLHAGDTGIHEDGQHPPLLPRLRM